MVVLLYTVKETANILKVNRNKIYSLIKSGNLKAIKLGTLKITHRSLINFLEEGEGKDYSDMNNVTYIKNSN